MCTRGGPNEKTFGRPPCFCLGKGKIMPRREARDGDMSDRIDIKVFILFLLDELRYPLGETVIAEMVHEHGYVGRFDFAECFSELTERGHITEIEDEGEKQYVISPLGHSVASELQGTLHEYIREKSRISALKRLSLYRRGAKTDVTVTKEAEGKYLVRCVIRDKDGLMMDTTMSVPSVEEAERIKKHFNEQPEEVCRGVLTVLTGQIAYYMGY